VLHRVDSLLLLLLLLTSVGTSRRRWRHRRGRRVVERKRGGRQGLLVPERVRRRETLLLLGVVGVTILAAGGRVVAVVLIAVGRVRRHERCVRHQGRSRFCVAFERERSPAEQRRGGGGGGGGSLIARRVVREGTAIPRGLHVGDRVRGGGGGSRGALTFLRPFDHDVDRQDVLRDKQRLPVRRSDAVLVIIVDRDAVPRAVVLARKELEAFRAFDCTASGVSFSFTSGPGLKGFIQESPHSRMP
jgi:hypothetical protein